MTKVGWGMVVHTVILTFVAHTLRAASSSWDFVSDNCPVNTMWNGKLDQGAQTQMQTQNGHIHNRDGSSHIREHNKDDPLQACLESHLPGNSRFCQVD